MRGFSEKSRRKKNVRNNNVKQSFKRHNQNEQVQESDACIKLCEAEEKKRNNRKE